MFLAVAVAVLLASAVAGGNSADQGPALLANPDWVKKPDTDQLEAAYPLEAYRQGVGGRAEITCVVNVHGLLENCVVVSESPAGMGFGAAALQIAPNFQMRPARRNGVPIAGASVNIPIHFLPPGAAMDLITGGHMSINHAVWRSAPTFAELARAYPAKAGGVPGHVVFRCDLKKDGGLKNCDTLTQEPPDKGFEHAARSLLPRFEAAIPALSLPRNVPVRVNVPIRFVDPHSADFTSRRIGEPSWSVFLNPASVVKLYPPEAVAKGVRTGRGTADCEVGPDGALQGCRPGPADPEAMGFSEAAAVVASTMKMNLWTQEGGPVDGANVRIPIRFNYAPTPPKDAKSP